ncbi:MAG: hypothetical protein MI784_16645 [Cytophagales bacterium]|nr:hypothetical protein [Cytophagales bacterium]
MKNYCSARGLGGVCWFKGVACGKQSVLVICGVGSLSGKIKRSVVCILRVVRKALDEHGFFAESGVFV